MKFIFILTFTWFSVAEAGWEKIGDDTLTTKFGFGTPTLTSEFIAPEMISTKRVTYQPNVTSKFIIGLSYRTIGFSFGTRGVMSEELLQQKGNTESSDYLLRFMGKNTFEFFYQRYKGLFIENSSDIDPAYANSNNKIQRSDIITSKFGMNYYYNFHEKDFSLNVAFDQGGRPKSPSWSYFLFGSASHFDFKGESALIPSLVSSGFGDMAQLQAVDYNTATVGMGVGGMTNIYGLYLTGFLSFGFGYQDQTLALTGNTSEKIVKTGYSSSGRLGLGYNRGNNLVAIQLLADNVSANIKEGQLNSVTLEAGVFYGYRWDGVNIPLLNPIAGLFD